MFTNKPMYYYPLAKQRAMLLVLFGRVLFRMFCIYTKVCVSARVLAGEHLE